LEEERVKVAKFISFTVQQNLNLILEALAEKEGKKGDKKTMDLLMYQYGRDSILLTHRILDELMIREYMQHTN